MGFSLLDSPRYHKFLIERLISEALRHGDLIGVRIAAVDDENEPDPWTLPPSRKRPDTADQRNVAHILSKLSWLI